MLSHPADARKEREAKDERNKLKSQGEQALLKDIAALQLVISEALAGTLDRASLLASVAKWVALACEIKAQG